MSRSRRLLFAGLLALFLAAIIISTHFKTPYALPPGMPLQCGDCDGNGLVDILDAYAAARYAVGLYNLAEPEFSACNVAGIRGNQYYPPASVTASDALFIAQHVVGRRGSLNCIFDLPILFTSVRDGNSEIYLMDTNGSNERPFRFGQSDQSAEFDPFWSPDGSEIVFVSNRDTGSVSLGVCEGCELYKISANAGPSGVPTRLTNDGFSDYGPSWSPNGEYIAFFSDRIAIAPYRYNVHHLHLASGVITDLTTPSALVGQSQPRWNPDGSKIVYKNGRYIYKMDMDGSNKQQLTSTPRCSDQNPSWTFDGRIAFTRSGQLVFGCPPDTEIFTMQDDGSAQTRLIGTPGQLLICGSWTRDGSQILYHGLVIPLSSGYSDVHIVNSFTGSTTPLTNSPSSKNMTPMQ